MPTERYLLRADRTRYTYAEILEVRPGAVRLLVPSNSARARQRALSTVLAVAYLFVALPAFFWVISLAAASLRIDGAVVGVAGVIGLFAGLFAVELWWDNRSLPLLAENPRAAVPLEVLGLTSYGTMQELRARAHTGEIRVSVHGSRGTVAEALRLATPRGGRMNV